MYYQNTLLGAVEDLYCCDDRLGVELMGANMWNKLKKAVAGTTAKKILDVSATKKAANIAAASGLKYTPSGWLKNATKQYNSGLKYTPSGMLTEKLFGFNDGLGEELLGGWWTDLKRGVASATHKVLEAGENIPIADAAVERFRDIASVFNFGTKAASSASSAYVWWEQNKWKVIIIGGAVIVGGVYLLGRRGRK